MRKLMLALLALMVLPMIGQAQEPVHLFVLTDCLVSVNDSDAVSLKKDHARQTVRFGDAVDVQYLLAVKAGENNLCSEREVTTCELSLRLGSENLVDGHPVKVGENRAARILVDLAVDQGEARPGDIDLVMTIRKNNIELFSYSIPLTVK